MPSKSKLKFTTDTLIKRTTEDLIVYFKRFQKQLIDSEVMSDQEWAHTMSTLRDVVQIMNRAKEVPLDDDN